MFLPTSAPWLRDFETELLSFPDGRHDDQVDTVSQFLTWHAQSTQTALWGRSGH